MAKALSESVLSKALKNRLSNFLSKNSLNVSQFEKKARLSNASVKKIVDGTSKCPSINTVIKIASTLGCSTDELLRSKNRLLNNSSNNTNVPFDSKLYQDVCLYVLYYIELNSIKIPSHKHIEAVINRSYIHAFNLNLQKADKEYIKALVDKYLLITGE